MRAVWRPCKVTCIGSSALTTAHSRALDTPSVKLASTIVFRTRSFRVHLCPRLMMQKCRAFFRSFFRPSAYHRPLMAHHTGAKSSERTSSLTGTSRSVGSPIRRRAYLHSCYLFQTEPIPPHLLAIASGNLHYRPFVVPKGRTWSSGVWTEPELLGDAYNEFCEDTPR